MKLEFYGQIFDESSNIKFHQNPSRGEPSFSMRTDGHDEANSSFPQLRERVYKLCMHDTCITPVEFERATPVIPKSKSVYALKCAVA